MPVVARISAVLTASVGLRVAAHTCSVVFTLLVASFSSAAEPVAAPMHPTEAFQIRLRSGKQVDVRKLMQADQRAYDGLLRRQEASRQFLRLNHPNGKPYLFVSRRGTKLFGPLAGRYDNGQAMICLTYVVGNRHGSLLCWDEQGRPLVYEQYKNGVRNGLRCVFKSCGGACQEGHLWLTEEWSNGRRLASHLRTAQGQESSQGALNDQNADYLGAKKALADFEATLGKNEQQLKISVVQLAEYKRQKAQVLRAQAIASMIASQRSFGAMPVCRTGSG